MFYNAHSRFHPLRDSQTAQKWHGTNFPTTPPNIIILIDAFKFDAKISKKFFFRIAHVGQRHQPLSANVFASGPSTEHIHPQIGIQTTTGHQSNSSNVIGWPWCQSCRPFVQILLAQGVASIAGQGSPSAPWAFASPFPDYVYVPALVHRSQLGTY